MNKISKIKNNTDCVNITIVTYNRKELTEKTILSLVNSIKHIRYIITVVDNASSDGTDRLLQNLQERLIIHNYFLLKRNMGAAVACNLGWSLVDANFYMRLDNDILFNECSVVEKMIHALYENPEIGIMSCVYFHEKDNFIPIQTSSNAIFLQHKYNEITAGGCVLIKKDTFSKLGYWCEDYGSYGPEDGDYSVRCDKLGLKRYYLPDLNAVTHIGTSENESDEYRYRKISTQKHHFNADHGMFAVNRLLYEYGLRNLNMKRRYVPHIKSNYVTFSTSKEYIKEIQILKKAALKIFEDRKMYVEYIQSEKNINI